MTDYHIAYLLTVSLHGAQKKIRPPHVFLLGKLFFSLHGFCRSLCTRVVSSEISLGKFPEIYSNLSGNLLNNFFTL